MSESNGNGGCGGCLVVVLSWVLVMTITLGFEYVDSRLREVEKRLGIRPPTAVEFLKG